MFVSRDINLPTPIFIEQSTGKFLLSKRGSINVNRQFFIYYFNIIQITVLIIYEFDQVPAYNSING